MEEKFFYLSIAGLIIKITILPHSFLHFSEKFINNCLIYFKKFFLRTERKPKKIDFEIIVEDKLDVYKDKKENFFYTSILKKKSKNKIITYSHISFIHFNWLFEQLTYEMMARKDGFVFHCSAVKKDNQAIIFTAEDGGGKSTAMMMIKDKFTPIADDTGIVRKINQKYLFFPSPFRAANFNMLKIENTGFPIGKIFILKKAPFFKIERVKTKEMTSFLINQVRYNKEFSQKTINNFLGFLKKWKNFSFLYFKKEKEEFGNFLSNHLI